MPWKQYQLVNSGTLSHATNKFLAKITGGWPINGTSTVYLSFVSYVISTRERITDKNKWNYLQSSSTRLSRFERAINQVRISSVETSVTRPRQGNQLHVLRQGWLDFNLCLNVAVSVTSTRQIMKALLFFCTAWKAGSTACGVFASSILDDYWKAARRVKLQTADRLSSGTRNGWESLGDSTLKADPCHIKI